MASTIWSGVIWTSDIGSSNAAIGFVFSTFEYGLVLILAGSWTMPGWRLNSRSARLRRRSFAPSPRAPSTLGAGTFAGDGLADLYIHRREVPLVHPRYVELEHLAEEDLHFLLGNGVPADEAEVLSNSQRALSQVVKTAEPSVQLDGAESIEMGSRRLRVEWTPGHSPGHICLYDSADGLLFAGDHVLPELSPNIGLHPQSTPDPLHDYLQGLKRMVDRKPTLVLPAHGRPFADVTARVDALVSHHHRRLDQILEIVGREKKTAWQVALELWGPRDNFYEKRLALQEGLAHLQALAVQGRVSKSVTPGSVRWRSA